MRKIYQLLVAAICLSASITSYSQNNLAPGDLAIVSYQSDADPTNTFNPALLEFDDRFSMVVLKPGGLAAGTVIYITDRGWDGPNNIWLDEAYPPFTFGIGSEAVIKWVVPAGGIIQGKEVFFIGKYHDELPPGSEYYQWFAYSDEPGTIPLGTITNETPIVPTALPQPNGYTDGMSLFNAGDNILIFQTGPPAGPATNYNDATRRFITALLANIRPTNVGTPTSYAAWDVAPNVQNESSIPPGLVNGQTCFLMSPGPLPHPTSPVPGTVEPDNGKFSNCALSVAGTCTALQMSTLIYTTANWTYNNNVFPVTTSSSFCTYNILSNNTVTLSSAAGTNAQTICINTPITNITYNTTGATGATVTGLPAGVTGSWASNVVTISGTPTIAGAALTYTVTLTGGCGTVTTTGTIAVTANNTVTLTSAAGTNAQTRCINTAITNITYSTTGATGATVTGLPAGVTGSWAANVVTISGTPTVAGAALTYTVTLTGGCGTITATGTITVTANNTVTLSSAAGTNAQTVQISTPITNITYATTGATGATVTGLPPGVTGSWASNVVTISGSPTSAAGSPYTYTVTLTGGCGTVTTTGTITVTTCAVALTSAPGTNAQSVCNNTAITNITYATVGATGATFSGLPPGVTGNWVGNVVTISGTPTAIGVYNYTVTQVGGACNGTVANGTITVNGTNTVTLTSAVGTNAQTVCINTPITNITYATTVATGATVTGLPAGVTGNWASNVVTISGTPTVAGAALTYTVTLTGGCGSVSTTGTIAVTANNTVALSSAAGTNAQAVCVNTPITTITYNTTGATGATVTGLPAGVTGSWAANVVTISGTPTVAGAALTYTVTLTGGCGTLSTTGSIAVTANNTMVLTSAPGTNAQTVCVNTPITTITYNTTSATGATVTGLPAGVTGSWAANVVTISGTPTVAGAALTYTVTLTGGCGTLSTTGSIAVTANNTIVLTSAPGTNAQTVAVNTPITNITYATTGATGATITGLPAGVTGNWAANVVTISGSPITTVGSPFTYTVTLTGGCGAVTATGTITVLLCTVPTVTCPGNISLNNTTGQCGRAVTYSATITGIPAPTVTYSFTGATTASGSGDGSGSNFNVGVTTVTITATNICSSSSCSFTVTITDNQAPTVSVGTIASCYSTVAAAESAALAATSATDNCPGVLTETASTVGTCSAVVTVTTTDVAGNATAVTYNTRIDNIAPTVTVGTIGSCYPTVAAAEAAALAATSATDNCPGLLVETASTVGTCSAVVTVTTTDGCGNATAVTYNTRIDNTAPTVTVGTIGSCYPTVAAAEAAALAATSATDNCPGLLVETASTVGTCSAVVTVTTTDACGNATAVTYNTRIDNTPPVLTCPAPVTVSCASAVPAPNVNDVTGVSDNCVGTVTVTHQGDVISGQTCSNRFTITRTYRATDVCGNFAECTQIITVNDQTPPSLTCPAPVTVSCASAVPAPNVALVTGVSDNCGGTVTVTHQGDVISGQTCSNRFTITRTYRATDVCGNFAECTQIITVNDQTPPTLTCPAPLTVSCASAVPAPNIALVTGVSDNCGGTVTVTHQGDVISGQTCSNRFTITRTYRATDVCGNFAECTQIITVNDQTPPTLTCPAPLTVSCASAVPAPNIALVTGVSDNCGGTVTVTFVSDVVSNQTCANRFTITRTYRATDVCGNFAQCTQIITVNDQTPPVVTCPAAVTVSCASAVPVPNTTLVTATDNCAGVITITHIGDVISNQTCTNRYTITRTYRATDVCGNFAECTQIITVNDQTAPVITCPANITVTSPAGSCNAVVNFTVTATDNCNGPVTIVSNPASGFAFPVGITTVTSTATDACGNSSTCTFTVTVLDGQLPVVTAQPVNRTVCSGGSATFNVTAITSPNAGGPIAYQWQQWNGSAWVNIAGATASSYTVSNATVSMNTNTFRVVLTGLCSVVNSNAATLFVNPLPSISLSATPPPSLLPNQTTTLTATTNPSGGTYAWFFNGTAIPGVTGPVLGPIGVDGIGSYRVVYTDPLGCVNNSATINVTGQPSNQLWVYPNPNQGQFQVRYYNQVNEKLTLNIYNALGQKIYQKDFNTTTTYTRIDVNLGTNFSEGVYTVEVVNGAGVKVGSRRVLVRHP